MRTIQESFEYFECYFRGEIDVQLGFEPFIFHKIKKLWQGEEVNALMRTRMTSEFSRHYTYFIRHHYDWSVELAHKLCPSNVLPLHLNDKHSLLDFVYVWDQQRTLLHHALTGAHVTSFFKERLLHQILDMPQEVLDDTTVRIICGTLASPARLGEVLVQKIVLTLGTLKGFYLPKNLNSDTQQYIQLALKKLSNLHHVMKDLYSLEYLTRKLVCHYPDSEHPLLALGTNEHALWLHVFMEYAQLRYRDPWIYHMDDGSLAPKERRYSSHMAGYEKHCFRVKKRQQWYHEWQVACSRYIETLSDEQKNIMYFILRHWGVGKVKDFCTPQSIGLDLSELPDVEYQRIKERFNVQQSLTEESPVDILTSWMSEPINKFMMEETLMM